MRRQGHLSIARQGSWKTSRISSGTFSSTPSRTRCTLSRFCSSPIWQWSGSGTLFAVFLSTSDEMLPIFLAEQVAPMTILKIMGVKLMIGMVMGFVVDAAVRLARRDRERLRIHELCERDRCHCNSDCDACEQQPELAYDYEHDEEHEHHHEGGSILRSALKHTVQVTVFIFVITLVLDGALELVGEDALGAFLGSNPVLSVLGSALVGLIPNCAASVVIAQLYVEGALGAGAMMAGLLVSAGVGLLVRPRPLRPIACRSYPLAPVEGAHGHGDAILAD